MSLQPASTNSPRVVLIEDSEPIRQMISLYLTNNGMKVFEADTVSAGRRAVSLLKPQIVLLDLGLEDGDGIDLLPEIVGQKIPCMVISARSQALDRVISLEKGAHDYMTKPIELRELLLRMRRMITAQTTATTTNDTIWTFGEIKVDQALRAIITANGTKNVPITAMEFKLLRTFASRAGRVVDRAELAKVIGVRSVEVSRALDISVSRLRKKLRDAGYEVNLRSVRGSGYLFSSIRSRSATRLPTSSISRQALEQTQAEPYRAIPACVIGNLSKIAYQCPRLESSGGRCNGPRPETLSNGAAMTPPLHFRRYGRACCGLTRRTVDAPTHQAFRR